MVGKPSVPGRNIRLLPAAEVSKLHKMTTMPVVPGNGVNGVPLMYMVNSPPVSYSAIHCKTEHARYITPVTFTGFGSTGTGLSSTRRACTQREIKNNNMATIIMVDAGPQLALS